MSLFPPTIGDHLTAPIVWSAAFEMGDAEIDRQHRHFIEQVNAVTEAIRSDQSRDVLLRLMAEMIEDARAHFAYEESVFLGIGFRGAAAHAREHRGLEAKLADIASRMMVASDRETTVLLADELRRGLLNHLVYYDLQYKSELMHSRGR